MMQLLYDGSLPGLLTCVFEVYERKLNDVHILKEEDRIQSTVFAEEIIVVTDKTKADRVWKGLQKKLSKQVCKQIIWSLLSEIKGIENTVLAFIQYVFANNTDVGQDYSNMAVLRIAQTAKKVGREKHRMEAFVRFQLLKDGLFYAQIEPDFNVLPLILPHFKTRYADQDWLIYDLKRKYGIYYNSTTGVADEITISNNGENKIHFSIDMVTEEEVHYQSLWKDYFKNTGIPQRKNMKLHIQHVPRRYWKYLIEKC